MGYYKNSPAGVIRYTQARPGDYLRITYRKRRKSRKHEDSYEIVTVEGRLKAVFNRYGYVGGILEGVKGSIPWSPQYIQRVELL
jgi:hypothetical protein